MSSIAKFKAFSPAFEKRPFFFKNAYKKKLSCESKSGKKRHKKPFDWHVFSNNFLKIIFFRQQE